MSMDIRLNDAIDHYLSKVAPNRLKPKTLKIAHHTLKMWRKELKPRTSLRDITTGKILTVRDNYAEPATANRVISVLSSMFECCVEREWVDVNPCKRIHALRVHNEDTGKLILPREENRLRTMAYAIDKNLYVMLHLAFETGARLGELEDLTAADVDTNVRSLTFKATKNGSVRIVPISQDSVHVLKTFGLPGKLNRSRWNRCVRTLNERVRFHDIRHTMISRALARGVPIATVGKMVGHKSLAMTVRYQHVDLADLRPIVEAA